MSSSTAPSSQRTSTSSTPWTSPSSHSRSQLSSPKKLSTGGETRRPRKESQRDRDTLSFPSATTQDSAVNESGSKTPEKSKRSRKSPSALFSSSSSKTTDSLLGMTVPTRTTSNASTRSAKTSTTSSSNSRSDQWWEHVLPPGQLAERLRKAQANTKAASSSSNNKDATIVPDEGPKGSRNSILRSATPSERKTWTSLADYGREESRSSHEHGGTSVATSTRSSIGSIPFARSDLSNFSTASSSGAEDSPPEGRSPRLAEEMMRMDRSATSSPTSVHSMSRSMSSRRSRVMGSESNNEHVGLGIGSGKSSTTTSPIEFDDRFRHWSFNLSSASSAASSQHHHPMLRPFPSSSSSSSSVGGRQSPRHHLFAQTPEVSSEEDQGPVSRSSSTSTLRTTTTTTRTTRRVTRTSSSLRSFDATHSEVAPQPHSYAGTAGSGHTLPISSARRQSWAPSHNNPRHVSFNNSVEVAADDRGYSHQTIGRAAGRTHSMLNDTVVAEQDATQQRKSGGASMFESPFTRRPGAMPASTATTEALRSRGRRMPCYSAPTSPRTAFSALHPVGETKPSRRPGEGGNSFLTTPSSSSPQSAHQHTPESPDLALLSALGVSHTQLSTAGNIALTLTRQLSIPLRPMLQLTMFVSISSFTFMALAVFLVAGYFITAWDDVSTRGKRIQRNVSTARKSLNAGVMWCERLLTGEERAATSEEEQQQQHKRASSRIVTAPLRFAIAVPATIAYKLTPTSISESLGFQEEDHQQEQQEGEGQQKKPERPSSSSSARRGGSPSPTPTSRNSSKANMPPRPPLSSLLPSIFLTILIALGAGVASFFADHRGGAPAAGGPAAFASSARSSSALPPHASSHIPLRKANTVSGQSSSSSHYNPHHAHAHHHRRQSVRPYDVL